MGDSDERRIDHRPPDERAAAPVIAERPQANGLGPKQGPGRRISVSRSHASRQAASPCLPAEPASIEESAAAEEQDHDKDDEERVGVHVFHAGSRRPIGLSSCEHPA